MKSKGHTGPFPSEEACDDAVESKAPLPRYIPFFGLTDGRHEDAIWLAKSKLTPTHYKKALAIGITHREMTTIARNHPKEAQLIVTCRMAGATRAQAIEAKRIGWDLKWYAVLVTSVPHDEIMAFGAPRLTSAFCRPERIRLYGKMRRHNVSASDTLRFLEHWGNRARGMLAQQEMNLLLIGCTYAELDIARTFDEFKFGKYAALRRQAHRLEMELSTEECMEVLNVFQDYERYLRVRESTPDLTHQEVVEAGRAGVDLERYAELRRIYTVPATVVIMGREIEERRQAEAEADAPDE